MEITTAEEAREFLNEKYGAAVYKARRTSKDSRKPVRVDLVALGDDLELASKSGVSAEALLSFVTKGASL